ARSTIWPGRPSASVCGRGAKRSTPFWRARACWRTRRRERRNISARPDARLLVLFGIPGAGKTYVGRVLAADFGFHFRDVDQDLPDEMREAIVNKQPVTDAMRDAFF